MRTTRNKSLVREALLVLLLSVFLALVYNAFSQKSLPLIRKPPVKIATADSALFSGKEKPADSISGSNPTVTPPLYERTRASRDSVAPPVAKKKDAGYKVVTLDQVKRLLGESRGLFIDGREPDEYAKGHIRSARNIPYLEVDKHFEELVTIPRDTLIIIYCHNPECSLGRDLADFMSQMEFHNLYLYDKGWDEWVASGMAVEKSSTGDN
ncbi:MAG: rhodanese-like domain-containing protein [Bacteroidota bacterium]|jgi:rhodanese-related sulfurtransferase